MDHSDNNNTYNNNLAARTIESIVTIQRKTKRIMDNSKYNKK